MFDFTQTKISGVVEFAKKKLSDERGYLSRVFCEKEFHSVGVRKPFVQINITCTNKAGTVRGMHFQKFPHQELKVIQCLRGKVFDVALDLRENSPTYLHWTAVTLSSELGNGIVIPEGVAHGFQTLTDDCELLYFHTEFYAPDYESGIHVQDEIARIEWPLPIMTMSERDRHLPTITR